jgi:hypothetical protein
MRNAIESAILAVLPALLAAGCGGGGGGDGQPQPPGGQVAAVDCAAGAASLEGSFKAPNGTTPVADADVTISTAAGCTAKTSAAGQFKFVNVPAAAATVTATKGMFQTSFVGATPGGAPIALTIAANAATFAYVDGAFDSIQDVLAALGFGVTALAATDLATVNLAQYDAVFLNCGLDEGPATDPTILTSLAAYVNGGGSLYASDWAYSYVEGAFPGRVSFVQPDPRVGDETLAPVTAQVLDASLQATLGRATAEITFDLPSWAVIDAAPAGTAVLIAGPATYLAGTATKPYAVRFAHGTGRVTYTSFHNEAQPTADMRTILQAMVFGL